jgi:hypothetical protein
MNLKNLMFDRLNGLAKTCNYMQASWLELDRHERLIFQVSSSIPLMLIFGKIEQ